MRTLTSETTATARLVPYVVAAEAAKRGRLGGGPSGDPSDRDADVPAAGIQPGGAEQPAPARTGREAGEGRDEPGVGRQRRVHAHGLAEQAHGLAGLLALDGVQAGRQQPATPDVAPGAAVEAHLGQLALDQGLGVVEEGQQLLAAPAAADRRLLAVRAPARVLVGIVATA
jgi:hypothetical protein